MTEQEFLALPPREQAAIICEKIRGWQRIQAPQFDCDGPLPEQGEVLAAHGTIALINSGEYQWPPRGVIPFIYFVDKRIVADMAEAVETAKHICARGPREFMRKLELHWFPISANGRVCCRIFDFDHTTGQSLDGWTGYGSTPEEAINITCLMAVGVIAEEE